MEKYVIKRNGGYKLFESFKIKDAIEKSFNSVTIPYDQSVFESVISSIESKDTWAVEEIQDVIEKVLFQKDYFTVMRSFMLFRHTRKLLREHIYGLNDDTTYIDSTQTIEEYISQTDWRINANANTSYSNAGLVNNVAGKIIANYWLDKVYTKEEGYAHRNGDLHIHDLDCLTGYCAGWSLRVLLNDGFNGVRGRVESKAPSHFREALGQMANFLGILQSEWAGAQAFSSFDTYLAPYVFKDNLSYDDVLKAIRSFVYNLNVPARWGQSPFTNITLDWVVPSDLKDQIPTKNNLHFFEGNFNYDLLVKTNQRGVDKPTDLRYEHFQAEMNLINKAYYTVMTEGDAHGQPFTFPIPTVNITEDFDWDGENTDLLFENTAKIGSSYFQNFIGSQYVLDKEGNQVENPNAYKPNAVRSMCCRLQLDLRELLKRGNGLFGSAEMTGSIGVVTINMARLGYLYAGNKNELYTQLDKLMEIAKTTLEKKRVFIQEMYDRGLYPYTKRYLPHFRNHFSTIGVNGMNEMVRNFTNDKFDITSSYGNDICIEILNYIRNRMKIFQEETGNLYNLEATPAEGTTYRFAKEDKKRYSNILQAGIGENIYYTNSSQIPVDFTQDPFEALLMQDELQCKYTGGTVLHLYMNERISSPEACKNFVKTVLTKFKLPYITVTPVFSVCPIHGYLNGEHDYCPKCDETIIKNQNNTYYEKHN
jgi:anaerobic ribonucleoside-triphosphate reductase